MSVNQNQLVKPFYFTQLLATVNRLLCYSSSAENSLKVIIRMIILPL